MRIKKNIAVVAAGALLVVGAGATGAVADKMIGSNNIKKSAVKSKHIANGTIKKADLSNGVKKDIAASNVDFKSAKMADATIIDLIGGPINDNNTDLKTSMTLPAGTYLVTVDGSFFNTEGDLGTEVYTQLSLWLDKNGDNKFRWQDGEGDISPNAQVPNIKGVHIAVSGNTVLTLDKATKVGLVAHGYTATRNDEGSGKIEVDKAMITATKVG